LHSFAKDETTLRACAAHVKLNPVRAGLLARAEHWPWSSARAHLEGANDELVSVKPLLERTGDSSAFLAAGVEAAALDRLPRHANIARPPGSDAALIALEAELGRCLRPRKPAAKPKTTGNEIHSPRNPERICLVSFILAVCQIQDG
jgi:putative transposase